MALRTGEALPARAAAGVLTMEQRAALDARYDRILEREGAALRRVAAGYESDPGRREDLFQDICLAIWRALPRFRGESSERTFVFRIAHNRGLTHRSRSSSPRALSADLEEAPDLADPAPSPEAEVRERQRRERLWAAVLALPVGFRLVISLTLEGLNPKEIADVLGITENNAAVRLSRARRALRQVLEDRR